MSESKKSAPKITLAEKAKYIAEKDRLLPVFHKGKIVHISDKEAVELERENLSYESRVELLRAIKNKHVKAQ